MSKNASFIPVHLEDEFQLGDKVVANGQPGVISFVYTNNVEVKDALGNKKVYYVGDPNLQRIASSRQKRTARREKRAQVDLRVEVTRFLYEHPNARNADLFAWVQGKGFNADEVEKQIFFLASVSARFLSSGDSIDKRYDRTMADPNQLTLGKKVEKEHCRGPVDEIVDVITEKIALDHLAENPVDYYQPSARETDVLLISKGEA